jgi:pimeloyl-ACP methyl ester carboxylesterase
VFIDLRTHRLHVETVGSGALCFVCLHGLADTLDVWGDLSPILATRGRVVLIDQRAHGASSAPAGGCQREDLAADVIAVIDQLGIRRAVLVGHSLGGIVAMTTTLAHPERVAGLILLGTASECSERVAQWYERIARAAEADGIAGFRRAIYGAAATKELTGDAGGLAQVTRALKRLHDDPLTPQLPRITCPTLLCVGDKDPMGPGASIRIQRQVAGAEVEVIAGHGHWLQVEAIDLLRPLIERFVDHRVAPHIGAAARADTSPAGATRE